MSALKSLCFSLVIGVFLNSGLSIAQETESVDVLVKKAAQYYNQKDYNNAL